MPDGGWPTAIPFGEVGTSKAAWASLILGILWLFWIGSVLAFYFGLMALYNIRESGGRLRGRWLAIAGLVLGIAGIIWLSYQVTVNAPSG